MTEGLKPLGQQDGTSLDDIDAAILKVFQKHPRATVVNIAESIGLARSTVQTRLSRLESLGALNVTDTHRIPSLLGYAITAFVSIEVRQRDFDLLGADLRRIPEVVEAFGVAGDGDVICKVVARDATDLGRITHSITKCTGAERLKTAVVLSHVLGFRLEPLLSPAAVRTTDVAGIDRIAEHQLVRSRRSSRNM